jgi:hypothetical protein
MSIKQKPRKSRTKDAISPLKGKTNDGILAKTEDEEDFLVLVCELDNRLRIAAIARFNVLESLNPELYANYTNYTKI